MGILHRPSARSTMSRYQADLGILDLGGSTLASHLLDAFAEGGVALHVAPGQLVAGRVNGDGSHLAVGGAVQVHVPPGSQGMVGARTEVSPGTGSASLSGGAAHQYLLGKGRAG